MKKLILSFLLVLCLVVGMLPMSASAEYVSSNWTLSENTTLNEPVYITGNVTLDLAGFELNLNDFPIEVMPGASATLTITDSASTGSIICGSRYISNSGTLIVNGGSITSYYECIFNQGYLIINDGTINGDYYGVNNVGNLTINGGNIKGGMQAIVGYGSQTIAISGGIFSHKGEDSWLKSSDYAWKNNTDSVTKVDYPYAVGVISEPVTITFDENYGDTPKTTTQTIDKNVETSLDANTFTRKGYNFKGWARSANGEIVYADAENVTFSADTTLYAVWEQKQPVSSVYNPSTGNTTEYTSLVDAMEQASDGDTITLIADYTEYDQIVAPEGKTLTLDLNGHTVTSDMEQTLMVIKGTLTIDDSTQGNNGKIYGPNSASHSFSIAIPENGNLYVKGGMIETTGHTVIHTTYGGSQRIEISDNAAIKGSKVLGCWSCSSSCTHIFVTGGIFSSDVSQFVADGYVLSNNTDAETQTTYPYMVSHEHKWDTLWTTNSTNHWHICTANGCDITDYSSCGESGAAYSTHEDIDKNHACDECGVNVGTHADSDDNNHVCDYGCSVTIGTCEDKDKDHTCDYGCGKTYGTHEQATGKHICDYCGATMSECSGGTATCTKKAICSVCGAEYGEMLKHTYGTDWKSDKDNHWHECSCSDKADIAKHTPKVVNAKEATTSKKGYTGDTVCEICGYEIAKGEDIPVKVTPTEPNDSNPTSPETGDSSNMTLWFVLLIVSTLSLVFIVILGKKEKKRNN